MEWFGYVLCIFIGVLIALGVQWIFLVWYIQSAPVGNPAILEEPLNFSLPKNLENMGLNSDNGDCAAAVSLTLQFLFQELKHAPAPLAWLHRKLHQEMLDLLTRTTSGKLFESLKVRNVLTGDVAPRVRWAGVQNVETDTGGYLKTVDLILDVHYSGGFKLTVDAGMLLGKTACFHVEVAHLSGRARVRFTREPYTHWSFSFLNPPYLELNVQPLQKRIAALLQAHARRALQKRHTLPNYTIRYKPFFTKVDPSQFDPPLDDPTLKLQGTTFEINVVEISRLYTKLFSTLPNEESFVYFTLSLDSNPWISYRQNEEYNIFTIDIVVNKERSQQLGTVFKQVISNVGDKSSKSYVVIETVVPLSAAYKADLRRDDVIIAVDSKLVTSMSQIVKIIKGINRPCFTIRIERRIKKQHVFKKDDIQKHDSLLVDDMSEDGPMIKRGKSNSFSFRKMSEVIENAKNAGQEGKALLKSTYIGSSQEQDSKSNLEKANSQDADTNMDDSYLSMKMLNSNSSNSVSFSKHNDSLSFGFGLRKRRCSVENKTSSDSSNSSTPTASNPGTPSKRIDKSNREQVKLSMDENLKESSQSIHSSNNSDGFYEVQKSDIKSIDGDKIYNSDSMPVTPKISIVKVKESSCQNKNRPDTSEFSDLLQTHTSKTLSLSDIIHFNEKISFKLNRNHRYMNLNIWGRNNNSEDTLLAYLNIPLQTVLKECTISKISQHLKKYILLSPEVNLSASKTHPLATHSGFEPCLCYGDILITSYWPNQMSTIDSKIPQDCKITAQNSESDYQDEFELLETANIEETILKQKSIGDDLSWKPHDFIRTHFHRSTQCDYCKKKIWLKDAVQCRDCAMCCHKKCVSKCLNSVRCPLSIQQDEIISPSKETVEDGISQMPEFSMTEYITSDEHAGFQKHNLGQKSDEGLLGRNTLSGFLGGLRRVGSAHNLSPLGPNTHAARSLPPSPHHTPSRSQSPDDDSAWHALEVAASDGIKSATDLLKPLLAAHLSSDLLLSKARDFGPRLLAHLPTEERTERLSNLISEVRSALDEENSKLVDLQSSMSNKNLSSQEKVKLNSSLEECEERSQALTALLLHCCSAMQSANKHSM